MIAIATTLTQAWTLNEDIDDLIDDDNEFAFVAHWRAPHRR